MVIAVIGVWNLLTPLARLLQSRHSHGSATAIASIPVLFVSLGIIVAIVMMAELTRHVVRPRATPTPPPVPFQGPAGPPRLPAPHAPTAQPGQRSSERS